MDYRNHEEIADDNDEDMDNLDIFGNYGQHEYEYGMDNFLYNNGMWSELYAIEQYYRGAGEQAYGGQGDVPWNEPQNLPIVQSDAEENSKQFYEGAGEQAYGGQGDVPWNEPQNLPIVQSDAEENSEQFYRGAGEQANGGQGVVSWNEPENLPIVQSDAEENSKQFYRGVEEQAYGEQDLVSWNEPENLPMVQSDAEENSKSPMLNSVAEEDEFSFNKNSEMNRLLEPELPMNDVDDLTDLMASLSCGHISSNVGGASQVFSRQIFGKDERFGIERDTIEYYNPEDLASVQIFQNSDEL